MARGRGRRLSPPVAARHPCPSTLIAIAKLTLVVATGIAALAIVPMAVVPAVQIVAMVRAGKVSPVKIMAM
jgi:hypothetical protein